VLDAQPLRVIGQVLGQRVDQPRPQPVTALGDMRRIAESSASIDMPPELHGRRVGTHNPGGSRSRIGWQPARSAPTPLVRVSGSRTSSGSAAGHGR
jgi:hypothetical protein